MSDDGESSISTDDTGCPDEDHRYKHTSSSATPAEKAHLSEHDIKTQQSREHVCDTRCEPTEFLLDCPIHKHAQFNMLKPPCNGLSTTCIASVRDHLLGPHHSLKLPSITMPFKAGRRLPSETRICYRCADRIFVEWVHGYGLCPMVLRVSGAWAQRSGNQSVEREWMRIYRAIYPDETSVQCPCKSSRHRRSEDKPTNI